MLGDTRGRGGRNVRRAVLSSVVHDRFSVQTSGRGLVDITSRVDRVIADSALTVGLATVFVRHTSASLLVQENADPSVRRDLDAIFARLAPDGDPLFTHTDEGPDDMSAHVRAALTSTSLQIPVVARRLDLGTWQGVFLWEHRTSPHTRHISVTVIGSET